MQQNNNSEGFYGPDGEFYPKGSEAYEAQTQSYPRRPNISYTTTSMQYQQPTPERNNSIDGYTGATIYCKYCGKKIPEQAVVCVHCGCQVGSMNTPATQPIVINNNNSNINTNTVTAVNGGKQKNKWVAVLLCIFLGYLGIHRFYEGKIPSGILYFFTGGLCGVGVIIDLIILLCKPNPYYV